MSIDKALQQLFKRAVVTKKLWTNASPDSTFAPQKLTLQESDGYWILCRTHIKDGLIRFVGIAANDARCLLYSRGFSSNPLFPVVRSVICEGNTLTFGDAYIQKTPGADTKDNTCVVPVEIYGITFSGGCVN